MVGRIVFPVSKGVFFFSDTSTQDFLEFDEATPFDIIHAWLEELVVDFPGNNCTRAGFSTSTGKPPKRMDTPSRSRGTE